MSTTDTTRTEDTGVDSVWGAPPPASDTGRPAPARRWLPDMVKTRVAALLAAGRPGRRRGRRRGRRAWHRRHADPGRPERPEQPERPVRARPGRPRFRRAAR